MNIKKAEELSGVSRQNIRFYEREGLLHPERNAENDYREYREEHIHTPEADSCHADAGYAVG